MVGPPPDKELDTTTDSVGRDPQILLVYSYYTYSAAAVVVGALVRVAVWRHCLLDRTIGVAALGLAALVGKVQTQPRLPTIRGLALAANLAKDEKEIYISYKNMSTYKVMIQHYS